jgi:hypothetical protein
VIIVGDIGKGKFIVGQALYNFLVQQIAITHFHRLELAVAGLEFAVFAQAGHMTRGMTPYLGGFLGRVPGSN